MMSGVGGVYNSLVFRQQDAPRYVPGVIATGLLGVVTACMAPIISYVLWKQNKKAGRDGTHLEGAVDFRYTC